MKSWLGPWGCGRTCRWLISFAFLFTCVRTNFELILVYIGFHRSARKEDIFKFKAYHLEKTVQVLKDCSAKVTISIVTIVML